MLLYVAKRVGMAVIVLFIVVTAVFLITHLIPSDPARVAAGLDASPEQVEITRKALGLDLPVYLQYLHYLGGLFVGDFGISYTTRQPLAPALFNAFPATLELILFAFVIYVILGVGAGVLWAVLRDRPIAGLFTGVTSLLSGVPVFWLAIVLQLWLAGRLGIFPINGRLDLATRPPTRVTGFYTIDSLLAGQLHLFGEAVAHLALPVAVLVAWMFAMAARLTQKSVMVELAAPYVVTAQAKGASPSRVMFRHVFRNAMNPVVTMLGLQFGWLLGGTVLVEVVFSWPGMGTYMYSALKNFDFPVITAVAVVITVSFAIVNLLVDLLYPVLDPRVRRA